MKADIILTTIDKENEKTFCHNLVKGKFAACVERFDVRSVYSWEGELKDEEEVSLIIKTLPERLDACLSEIEATHPYDTPQIITLEGGVRSMLYFEFMKNLLL